MANQFNTHEGPVSGLKHSEIRTADAPVAVAGYAQVYPHPHGYEFQVSMYADKEKITHLPEQDYTGTSHSLGDALTYISNITQARNLKRMLISIRRTSTSDASTVVQSAYDEMTDVDG